MCQIYFYIMLFFVTFYMKISIVMMIIMFNSHKDRKIYSWKEDPGYPWNQAVTKSSGGERGGGKTSSGKSSKVGSC